MFRKLAPAFALVAVAVVVAACSSNSSSAASCCSFARVADSGFNGLCACTHTITAGNMTTSCTVSTSGSTCSITCSTGGQTYTVDGGSPVAACGDGG
jgi:hypothetical protein